MYISEFGRNKLTLAMRGRNDFLNALSNGFSWLYTNLLINNHTIKRKKEASKKRRAI